MTLSRFVLRALALTPFVSTALFAQMGPPLPAGTTKSAAEIIYIGQTDAGLEGGGDMSMSRYGIKAGFMHGLEGGHAIGAGLGFTEIDYSFSGLGASGPWDNVTRWGVELQYRHAIDRESSFFVMPSLTWEGEDGSSTSDQLVWGAVGGYIKQFGPDLMLGFGAGVFVGQEETSGFPVIFVRWQIDENWYLGNPFRPGPTGPAGLEIVYTAVPDWEFGFGGGYRNDRFALDKAGVAPGGYGENSGAAMFLRASRNFGGQGSLDFYLGTIVGGELQLDDRNGRRLSRVDYDPSLLFSIAYSVRW